MYRERRKQLFDAWSRAAHEGDAQGPQVLGIRRNLPSEPAAAHLGQLVTRETFLKEAMREASTRPENAFHFDEKEQKDFIALIAVKVQELIDAGYLKGAQAGQPDSGSEVPRMRPMQQAHSCSFEVCSTWGAWGNSPRRLALGRAVFFSSRS